MSMWTERAKCRGLDTELFYLPTNARKKEKANLVQQAKIICADCPVRAECLEYALAIKEKYGVWGGLSEEERVTLLRRRARLRARVL